MAVELSDGRVMLNIRHEGKPGEPGPGGTTWRAVSISPDGATDWSHVRLNKSLPEPVCMASLVRRDEGGKGVILFTNPHNATRRERKNLTVKLSEDDGATWPIAASLGAITILIWLSPIVWSRRRPRVGFAGADVAPPAT